VKKTYELIISKLAGEGLTVCTEDDLTSSENRVDEILKALKRCRFVMLILSPSFIGDAWCRHVARQAVASQRDIVPVVLEELHIEPTDEMFFSDILSTCRPIHWREEDQGGVLREITSRLSNDLAAQIIVRVSRGAQGYQELRDNGNFSSLSLL